MTLGSIFRSNWKKLTLTYFLFNVENALSLLKPYFLGKAIDLTVKSDIKGIIYFLGLYCIYAIVGGFRRINDTRTFSKIYANIVTKVVHNQNQKNVNTSTIAARASLSNKFVDFFETDVTVFFQTLYNIFGALVLLFIYMKSLLFYCIIIMIPIALLNKIYAKKNLKLLKSYNNQIEKAVDNISSKDKKVIDEHYSEITKLRIKISDNEAFNFLSIEIFIIFLIGISIGSFYGNDSVTAGTIVAVFQYVNMFILGIDDVPYLIEQINKIKDIQKRLFDDE